MLNRSACLAMSTSVLKALPGKLDIKRHSPSNLYLFEPGQLYTLALSTKFSWAGLFVLLFNVSVSFKCLSSSLSH